MERTKDATNENIGRGREERFAETQREGLEDISRNSPIIGNQEQVGACDTDSTGENLARKLTPVRDTTAGKILERLEALEAQHLEYVHSHQARLEARLGESKQAEIEFKEESNQIKSDIYHLATAQQTNGNGSN